MGACCRPGDIAIPSSGTGLVFGICVGRHIEWNITWNETALRDQFLPNRREGQPEKAGDFTVRLSSRIQMLFVGLLAALGEPLESSIELTGAGATFPQPFYEYAFNRYPTAEPSLVVRYQGVGSGAGAVSLLKREVDFAASDVVFSDEERKRAAADLVEVPTCLGAVTVVVNLPGNPRIRLTSEILAAMFLGRITHWNDRDIINLNPSATLQALPITVSVYCSCRVTRNTRHSTTAPCT